MNKEVMLFIFPPLAKAAELMEIKWKRWPVVMVISVCIDVCEAAAGLTHLWQRDAERQQHAAPLSQDWTVATEINIPASFNYMERRWLGDTHCNDRCTAEDAQFTGRLRQNKTLQARSR